VRSDPIRPCPPTLLGRARWRYAEAARFVARQWLRPQHRSIRPQHRPVRFVPHDWSGKPLAPLSEGKLALPPPFLGVNLDSARQIHGSGEYARPHVMSPQRAADDSRDVGRRNAWIDGKMVVAHNHGAVYDHRALDIDGRLVNRKADSIDARRYEIADPHKNPIFGT
jgi:hypothetical protein